MTDYAIWVMLGQNAIAASRVAPLKTEMSGLIICSIRRLRPRGGTFSEPSNLKDMHARL